MTLSVPSIFALAQCQTLSAPAISKRFKAPPSDTSDGDTEPGTACAPLMHLAALPGLGVEGTCDMLAALRVSGGRAAVEASLCAMLREQEVDGEALVVVGRPAARRRRRR